MSYYSLKERANNHSLKFIVAIDGTSASGKGTIAKRLSEIFHMEYFASSVFYRRLASLCCRNNISEEDIENIIILSQDSNRLQSYSSNDLYNENITNFCSKISVIQEVRNNLKPLQRTLIDNNLRVILDGRDIGTVIAPDAHLKLFVNASLKDRAERRYNQLQKNNISCNIDDVLKNLETRDERDMNRKSSPLKAAEDAYVIDNSGTEEETIAQVMNIIDK